MQQVSLMATSSPEIHTTLEPHGFRAILREHLHRRWEGYDAAWQSAIALSVLMMLQTVLADVA